MARDVDTFGHAPIVAGVVTMAAALEEIVLHPSDPLLLAFRMISSGINTLLAESDFEKICRCGGDPGIVGRPCIEALRASDELGCR